MAPSSTPTATENCDQSKAGAGWRGLLAAVFCSFSGHITRRTALAIAFIGIVFAAPANAQKPATTIAVLGDSLTAGYGLPEHDAFPAQLEAALKDRGHDVRVVNAGVSGDTTAGGRSRLDWTLADKPQIVIVELGANDTMRGLDPDQTEANLDDILARALASGAKVLLTGMRAPPNYGRDYQQRFDAIYQRLAEKHGVPLYPFFLEGVAMDPKLNQADGIHPSAAGVAIIVKGILPAVEALLKRTEAAR